MTSRARFLVLLVFLSHVGGGNGELNTYERCNGNINIWDALISVDNVLTNIAQQVDDYHSTGFNIYYTSPDHRYHGHACRHPALVDQDCARCIHETLNVIRLRCWPRISGVIGIKDSGSNYVCEVRHEQYDMDGDYFSCARY